MLEQDDIKFIQQMIQTAIQDEIKSLDIKEDSLSMNLRMNQYHESIQNVSKNHRKAKVLFTNAGGSASKGSLTTRITLPITWIREMGITPENREVDILFEDGKIIIEKKK